MYHGTVCEDVAFFLCSQFILLLNEDHDGVLVRRLQELILWIFLADLDVDPADCRDVVGLFGLVGFMVEFSALHYFDNPGVLLDVVKADNRIFNLDAACDEFGFGGVISRSGVNDSWAVAVSVKNGLGEPGVT